MHFLQESILYWLPVAVLVLGGCWSYGAWKRRRDLAAWTGSSRSGVMIRLSYGKRQWRHFLLLLTVAVLLLAAARPWWGSRLIDTASSGSDVLVIVDVSKSMLAEDVAPSRLEHAKWLLSEVIRQCPDARFGIIAFAGKAFFSCPLTSDRVSLEQCIDELHPELVPVGGTDLAAALKVALKALKAAGGNQRTVLLLTDGEELHGSVAAEIADLKKAGIELLIAGLGDPNVPALIPETDASGNRHLKRDSRGELVKTTVNETLLRKLAAETGGMFLNTSPVAPGTELLVRRLHALEHAGEREVRRTLPIDRFMPLLWAASILYLFYMLADELPGSRHGSGRRHAALLLAGVLLGSAVSGKAAENPSAPLPEPETSIPLPNEAAKEPEAAPLPQDPQALYNLAREAQVAKNFDQARELYAAVIAAGGEARAAAFHNSGILEHTDGRTKLAESRKAVQSQQLDNALKTLETASAALDRAEEHYVNAMALPEDGSLPTTAAQQLLLNDRTEIEKLKKAIEELKKQQQQARQQTQQARQENQQKKQDQQQQKQPQNQQQNQQKQGQQGQQNQQQGQQDQKQQGQKQQQSQGQQGQSQQQQGQQDQEQPQQGQQDQKQPQQGQQDQQKPSGNALQNAQRSTEQLQKQAEQLGQQNLAEQAKKAADSLQKAEQAQQRSDFDRAEKDLQEAQKALGEPEKGDRNGKESSQSGEKKDGKEGEKGEKQSASNQKPDGKDRELPRPENSPAQAEPENGKPDGKSADALLDLMGQDEKLLRNELQKQRNRGIRPVEKDW